MLEKYRNRLEPPEPGRSIHLVCGGMEDIHIINASVVVINLTLQFLNPSKREDLIQRIFSGLVPGGILPLMEKPFTPELAMHHLQLEVYRQFKRENGYSDLRSARNGMPWKKC